MDLTKRDIQCLNIHPENTSGYDIDAQLIESLNDLCLAHGYDRVRWLVDEMHYLSYDNDVTKLQEKVDKFKIIRDKRLKLVK